MPVGEPVGRRADQPVEGPGCGGLGPGHLVEEPVVEHREPDQLLGGQRQPPLFAGGVLVAGAQQPGEAAYVAGVEPAERPEQQRLGAGVVDVVGGVLVVVVDVDRGSERVEERQDRRVLDERQLVAGHLDRDTRTTEGAAQRRDAGAAGADQHGHPVPGDAVLEVGAAEEVGEVLGLGPLGVEGAHRDEAVVALAAAAARVGHRVQERLARDRVEGAGQADPAGDALRRHQQPRPEAASGAQRDDFGGGAVGTGEVGRELQDAAHLGAPEAVDRLVRIADRNEVSTVARERAQQVDLAGVGVLVLVDVEVAELAPQVVAVDVGLDDRAPDQVGVVGGALVVEDVEVALEEQAGGDVRREVVLAAERGEGCAVHALLARPREHHLHLAGEAAGLQRAVERLGPAHRLGVGTEQLTQHDVLFGRAEQSQRGVVELARRIAADQPVGKGVDGRAHRRAGGAAEARGDPVAELLGGLAGERQRQHAVGTRAAFDAARNRLDEGRGLAGAGAGEHEQRAARVVDDALLVVVEHRRGRGRAGTHQAVRRGARAHVFAESPRRCERSEQRRGVFMSLTLSSAADSRLQPWTTRRTTPRWPTCSSST